MDDEFENDLGMARRVTAYLEDSANKPIWLNQPPMRFTTRSAELYPAIENFAKLGAQQSTGMKGSADQQNLYETALEDAAYPLSNALHEYYMENNAADKAAEWDLSMTQWRRMREQSLLGKAERLIEQVTGLTEAVPPKGEDHGITTAKVTTLTSAADNYGDEIGQPTKRRTQRRTDTAALRPTWRGVREILEAMDKLVVQFPKGFADGWFSARRIDDLGHGPGKPAAKPA